MTNLVLSTLLAFFATLVVVAQLVMPHFVGFVLAPGFDAPTSALTVRLARIIGLQPLILAWGSVAIAVLNSRNQFLLTGISIVSNNVALIAGIVAVGAFPGDRHLWSNGRRARRGVAPGADPIAGSAFAGISLPACVGSA